MMILVVDEEFDVLHVFLPSFKAEQIVTIIVWILNSPLAHFCDQTEDD